MTEMVYGSMPARAREPVLPRWWRTIDKWSLTAVLVLFGIGILLGLAASVPLAFDLARKDGRLKAGQTVLMQGVGGGFTWGAVLLNF
mgnify:CR=1 FL=1